MSGYAGELRTIESHFGTAWGATTPAQFENDASFVPPTDGSAFVRFYVLAGESFVAGTRGDNKRLYRHPGVIQVDILAPEGKGAEPALAYADQAAAIFRGKRVGDVVFRGPAISRPVPDGGYFRITVSVRYYRDEVLDIV